MPAAEQAPSELHEMETLGSTRTRSRSLGKLVSLGSFTMNRDYAVGIGLLLIVVFLWTSSNFVTQNLFEGGYEKPFLVTYLNTSAFTLYLIPTLIRRCFGKSQSRPSGNQYQPLATEPGNEDGAHHVDSLPQHTTRETANLAGIFCFFWFIANWSINAALDYTSVASATILSSTSGFFTMGMGRLFHVERMSLTKTAAVVASFGGVILVSLSDSVAPKPAPSLRAGNAPFALEHAPRPALGDALALVSAIFYALYVVLLKVRIRSEDRIDMQLFFGFVGLLNMISLWPVGVILHFTGAEKFELPSSRSVVAALLVNMFITWLSDFLYVIAMLKTTPLVVTVGLSLTIPLAVVGDFVFGNFVKAQVILGALLVIASFIVVGMDKTSVEAIDAHDHAGPLQ